MKVSAIVPVLNEGKEIEGCLRALRQNFKGEILVVDGGSEDDTVERALELASRVLHGPKGLANQCNFGAERAGEEILFFVACDVRLPANWAIEVSAAMRSPYVACGGFRLRIDSEGLFYRVISFGGNFRGRAGHFTLPDQGLFIRRDLFQTLGGLRTATRIPFADLCLRARRYGDFLQLKTEVFSSPRKWERHGKWRTTGHHLKTYFEFLLAEAWAPERR